MTEPESFRGKKLMRQHALEYLGLACLRCGHRGHSATLCFHHLDPKKKTSNIPGDWWRNWNKVRKEVDKCILLCRNCHAELHANGWTLPKITDGGDHDRHHEQMMRVQRFCKRMERERQREAETTAEEQWQSRLRREQEGREEEERAYQRWVKTGRLPHGTKVVPESWNKRAWEKAHEVLAQMACGLTRTK